jgi:hypothetical protein
MNTLEMVSGRNGKKSAFLKLQYFLIFLFYLLALYNAIYKIFFHDTVYDNLIDLSIPLIIAAIMLFRGIRLKLPKIYLLALLAYMVLSILFAIVLDRYFLAEIVIKNLILTLMTVVDFYLFLNSFYLENQDINRTITKWVISGIMFMVLFFVFYLVFRNSSFKYVAYAYDIVQDVQGRFQGPFSEPSIAGFFCISLAFLALQYLKRMRKTIAIFLVIVLYVFIKAKMAVVALPISIILAVCIKNLRINKLHVILLLNALVFIFILVLPVVNSEILNLISTMEYEQQGTFVTRWVTMETSFKHLLYYPIGTGFGVDISSMMPILKDYYEKNYSPYIYFDEIKKGFESYFGFGSKDTLSFAMTSFGFLGLNIFLSLFIDLIKKQRRDVLLTSFTLFMFISFSTYINIVVYKISWLILGIVLYEYKRRDERA